MKQNEKTASLFEDRNLLPEGAKFFYVFSENAVFVRSNPVLNEGIVLSAVYFVFLFNRGKVLGK